MRHLLVKILLSLLFVEVCAVPAEAQSTDKPNSAQEQWLPTGEWPFLRRRFEPATIVTGFINKKKTVYPCNIHIGNQTLMYVLNDTLMQASPGNVNYVEFRDGDKYVAMGNTFAKVIREDSIGRVLMVRLIDMEKFKGSEKDASHMGSFTVGGDFGSLSIDFSGSYIVNPEEEPLPTIDTYFINYNKEIFEVTDKNILQRIRPDRKKEFKAFTRSAEIISRNESSVLKIWDTFFVNY